MEQPPNQVALHGIRDFSSGKAKNHSAPKTPITLSVYSVEQPCRCYQFQEKTVPEINIEVEEQFRGSLPYMQVLSRLHAELAPSSYLEIGVRHGKSLALARGPAIGVDPAPDLKVELPETSRVLQVTSDEFFTAGATGLRPDFCFIDGMHLFENALRDFMNFERCSAPGAIAVIDDVFPNHPAQALRARRTSVWTGDVWRMVRALREWRTDLFILMLDTSPSGLAIIAGIDSSNTSLADAYAGIVKNADDVVEPPNTVLSRTGALDPSGEQFSKIIDVLKRARADKLTASETVNMLMGT